MTDPKTAMRAARETAVAFAQANLRTLAAEIVEWQDTGLLRNGKLHELAEILRPLDEYHSTRLAESIVNRAALDAALAAPSEEAREPLTNEQIEAAIDAWFNTDNSDPENYQKRMRAAIAALQAKEQGR